jgi:hypothetical protein
MNEPVFFSQTVENEAIEATQKILAIKRQKLGREPTVTELRRWAKVYRGLAERLEVLMRAQERAAAPARSKASRPRRRAATKRGAVREEA